MPDLENQDPQNPNPEPSDTTNNTPNPESDNPNPPVQTTGEIETLRNTYNAVLRESQVREQRLQEELDRIRNQQNNTTQPASTPEQDVELLTSNPRELIRQEMRNVLQPIQEQTQQFVRSQEVANLVPQLKNDPRFPYLSIEGVETYFKNTLNTVPQININTVLAAYQLALGNYVANGGTLTPQNPAPQPTTHSQSVPTPPPTPRSAPPIVPNNQPKKTKREYTENERLLMRLNNQTEEEYEAELNLLPSQVVVGPQK